MAHHWYSVNRPRVINPNVRGEIIKFLTENGPQNTTVIREALRMKYNTTSGVLCAGCDDGVFVRIPGANRRSYLYALPGQTTIEAAPVLKKVSHPERVAPPTYRAQLAREAYAEVERLVKGRV